MRYLLLCLFLSGCVSANVQTKDCTASYSALFHDSQASSFNVCGGTADTVGNTSAVSIGDILKAAKVLQQAGLK